ncbi:MJ0042 family finger-like domain protein [Sulfitobacter indolifex HEL-45]|uniref:MJ0042 family finger-like domain protein n=2 Tax=Sulfitobacter indolifex TaxID=225422 RepID=A0ABM9X876_9RHOB|nr:MJ0042 family finger-like domain protein [Sulfitobacter indolifex HEL-45]
MTMRLICPNCDAQYEVPDEVMPVAGRDVQCSNCGQTWFQYHPDNAPEEDYPEDDSPERAHSGGNGTGYDDPDYDDPDYDDDVMHMKQRATDDAGHEEKAANSLPDLQPFGDEDYENDSLEDDGSFEDDADFDDGYDFEPEEEAQRPTAAPTATAPVRRPLDPAIAEILRQEAAAEQDARRKRQSDPLETQPDLGLDDAPRSEPQKDPRPDIAEADHVPADEDARRAHDARLRMAKMRGEPIPESEAYGSASRRDLLPDIEEINSTLRHDRNQGQHAGPTPTAALDSPESKRKSGGFTRGFVLMIALAAILAAVYVYAPQIAQSMPQADPYLSSYVAWMDDARIWLDGQLQDLLVWLDTVATQSQG